MFSKFLSLPFYCCEADETLVVDDAQSSTETVETNSRSSEVVHMDALPSLPATPFHAGNAEEEEAGARRHACKSETQ